MGIPDQLVRAKPTKAIIKVKNITIHCLSRQTILQQK